MFKYKNLFTLLRVNQLLCCLVIIIALCISSDIARNSDPTMKMPDEHNLKEDAKQRNQDEIEKMSKGYVQKNRTASIFYPTSLLNNTESYYYKDNVKLRATSKDITSYPFYVLIVAIFAALITAILIVAYHLLMLKKSTERDLHCESYLYGLLVSFWFPMTIAVLYVLFILWSENYILSQYYRPETWLVGGLTCLCLLFFLTLDLVFIFISNVLAIFNEGNARNILVLERLHKGGSD